jgi:hypothetical protein
MIYQDAVWKRKDGKRWVGFNKLEPGKSRLIVQMELVISIMRGHAFRFGDM